MSLRYKSSASNYEQVADDELLDQEMDYNLWGIVEPRLPARLRRHSNNAYEKYRDRMTQQKDRIWNHPDFGVWSFLKVVIFLIGGVVKMVATYSALKDHLEGALRLMFSFVSAVPFGCFWSMFINISKYGYIRGLHYTLFVWLAEVAVIGIFLYAHFRAKAAFNRIIKKDSGTRHTD